MLRIRKVRRYRHARYPRGRYRARVRGQIPSTARGGVSALLLLALTEACDDGPFGNGQTGPPPVMPDLVTETEARQIIRQVFTNNGIPLQDDFPLVFRWAADSTAADSMTFDVDGFNDTLQVGFEYLNDHEASAFPAAARTAMAEAAGAEGPHIKLLDTASKDPGFDSNMAAEVQAFIDFLKAQGII